MENDEGLGLEPSAPAEHDFTVSALDLVTRTLKVWVRKLPSYILIGLIGAVFSLLGLAVFYVLYGVIAFELVVYIGTDIINTLLGLAIADPVLAIEIMVIAIVLTVVGMAANAVIAGGGIKFALNDYGSHQADVGASLSFALSRLSTIIVAQFLLTLVVVGPVAPGMFLILGSFATLDPLNPSMEVISAMMTGLGILALGAIVALFFAIRLAPTIAVVVAEDVGAVDSMKRAWQLTTGNFWHIFFGQIILGIAIAFLTLVIEILLSPLEVAYGSVIYMYFRALTIMLLFVAINYVFAAVLYRDLESRSRVTSQEYW